MSNETIKTMLQTAPNEEIYQGLPLNVLITGAQGMLGRYLCREFSKLYNVVTLGKNPENDISCDLSRGIPQLPDMKFAAVIHAAGTTDENEANAVNYLGTVNLYEALSKQGIIPQFVYISSASVYGQTSGENVNEDSPLIPTSQYGISKLSAERYLEGLGKQKIMMLTILRPPLILGTGMKGTLRQMVNGIDSGYYFNIKGNTARRSIVHAKDVAKAVFNLHTIGGTYNITDGINPHVNDIGKALAHRINGKRIYALPCKLAKLLMPKKLFARLTTTLTFNCDKLRSTIDWNPDSVIEYLLTHQYTEDDI